MCLSSVVFSIYSPFEGTRAEIRRYTERADGEAIADFSRREMPPSAPVPSSTSALAPRTRSTGVSPFDLAQLRAALDVDAAAEVSPDRDEDVRRNNSSSKRCPLGQSAPKQDNGKSASRRDAKKVPGSRRESRRRRALPLDKAQLIRAFEDLLYETELEEALLSSSLKTKNAHGLAANQAARKTRGLPASEDPDGNQATGSFGKVIELSEERIAEIRTHQQCHRRRAREKTKPLTKSGGGLEYHAIVEILTESILDGCLREIAEELQEVIDCFSDEIFQHL